MKLQEISKETDEKEIAKQFIPRAAYLLKNMIKEQFKGKIDPTIQLHKVFYYLTKELGEDAYRHMK